MKVKGNVGEGTTVAASNPGEHNLGEKQPPGGSVGQFNESCASGLEAVSLFLCSPLACGIQG